MGPNAVELTAAQAWYVAETIGAGSLPWVLAVTPPYSRHAERDAFAAATDAELTGLRVRKADGGVDAHVAAWLQVVCRAEQWLELRFVAATGDLLRGVVARRGGRTVVALRNAQLITFTDVAVDHPHALVPVVTAGLSNRPPARFDGFSLPAAAGARADAQIRRGAALSDVLDFVGVPASARPVAEAAFGPDRTYVEVLAGEHRDGHRISTEVGVGVVDTTAGRVLVSPTKAHDGEWVSTFTAGTPFAIAAALDRLTGALPGGAWFPDLPLTRDFDEHPQREPRTRQCPTTL